MDHASLMFLHRLNDGGLLFLNRYLEMHCECNVFHISPSRRLIYHGEKEERCLQLKQRIALMELQDGAYVDEAERFMVYRFVINEYRQELVFFPVDEVRSGLIMDELNRIMMPLSYYLRGLYYSFNHAKDLLQNDPEQIFRENSSYWLNLLNARMIDPEAPVIAIVADPGPHLSKIDELQRLADSLCLRDGDLDVMIYRRHGRLVLLVPGRYHIRTGTETGKRGQNDFPLNAHSRLLKETYGEGIVLTIGSAVPYKDMIVSYRQAMAARFYLDFFRKQRDIFSFEEMGPVGWMVRTKEQKITELGARYQLLNQYDNERSGYLMTTLRELVRSQFVYQEAAQRLHVHLNTLYYRQERLASLLHCDIANLDSKIILYEELYAYDFFGFMASEDGSAGKG